MITDDLQADGGKNNIYSCEQTSVTVKIASAIAINRAVCN